MERIKSDPFPGDPDANGAVRDVEVLETVAKLAVESHRLVHHKFRHPEAYQRQRSLVANLRGLIASRARSVHVDEAAFLEAARAEAERRARRSVRIWDMPPANPVEDRIEKRLRDRYADAELHEQAMLRKLSKAREAFTDAHVETEAARTALAHHRARKGRPSC